jgi:DNA-binding transcriptional regulator of glucitol operon
MAVTTRQSVGQPGPRWALLLRPRWLAWHSFVWIATVGMFFLGDWQLHRAESGNELSWAYTFEWPLFALFTVYFWIKSLRDELRTDGAAVSAESESGRAAAGAGDPEFTPTAAGSGVTATTSTPGPTASAGTSAADAASVPTARSAAAGRRADTWDATSWDATSWDATGRKADGDAAGQPVDIARATPADGEAYLARLMAEVQRPGRRRVAR